ncbi:PD-(D/E)XK nuclease family transposase [Adlercreutzia sp. R25]|uniref:PD-(D/E)XK nuclease family transposase n=1 Tax=Adlercreutzia shanghongiae TaxID=3111773 RepID=A0ABU6IZ62_9ACTN|nr:MULTISPECIES: PD-(D/E)XK nuclease family transposase [unclassified Adlercreutzia]MEC4273044.1 PD-(D/E)XK nuclease family transposase [Adlercreutzia sp. R25]MEC4295166.1 PD-(D/E)XK nuclease family transposase [Adlercreutzia sp. R22]
MCRGLIHALLGIEVGSIRYLNAEQPYEPGSSSRGVRMDIVAKEDGRIYDIEMQVGPEAYIGRRMRYYQAAMDVGELGPGEAWGQLPESHIIFICPTDLLAGGLPVYTINRICIEAPDFALRGRFSSRVVRIAGFQVGNVQYLARLHLWESGSAFFIIAASHEV